MPPRVVSARVLQQDFIDSSAIHRPIHRPILSKLAVLNVNTTSGFSLGTRDRENFGEKGLPRAENRNDIISKISTRLRSRFPENRGRPQTRLSFRKRKRARTKRS